MTGPGRRGGADVIAVAVTLAGLGLAWFVYGSGRLDWVALRVRFAAAEAPAAAGFYVDDVYGAARPRRRSSSRPRSPYVSTTGGSTGSVTGSRATARSAPPAGGCRPAGSDVRAGVPAGVVGVLSYLAVRAT